MQNTKTEKCKRTLTCILTDDEKRQYAEDLARTTQEISGLEDRKKEITSEYKSKIDKATADQRLFANKITTGREMREVDCVWEFNYSEGVKTLYRTDIGEEIDKKALTIEERQQSLDLSEQGAEEEPRFCPNAAPDMGDVECMDCGNCRVPE